MFHQQNQYNFNPYYIKQKEFWKYKLENAYDLADLGHIVQEPGNQDVNIEKISVQFNDTTNNILLKLTQGNAFTTYVTLISALHILLFKHTGKSNVLTYSPVFIPNKDNRCHNQQVPLFHQISGNISIKELLINLKECIANSYKNQDIPYELIGDFIKTENTEIPQVICCSLEGLHENLSVNTKLIHTHFNTTSNLTCELSFNANLYDKAQVHSIIEQFEAILNSALQDFNKTIDEIEYLPVEVKDKLLNQWNPAKKELPKENVFLKMFKQQVDNNPNDIAVVFEEKTYTYRDIDIASNRLAKELSNFDLNIASSVGVLIDRSHEIVISILAIFKAGLTYIPLDTGFPNSRIKYILEHSQTKHIITCQKYEQMFGLGESYNCIQLSEISLQEECDFQATLTDEAYVFYTSGSTGNPKGVSIGHKALGNFLHGMKGILGDLSQKKVLAVTTVSFDISLLELLLPIAFGGICEVCSNETQANYLKLADNIKQRDYDIVQLTPSRLKLLISSDESNCLHNINTVLVGGEAFPQKLFEKTKEVTNAKIFNMYGPTETTIWSTVQELTNEEKVSIGTPILNTEAYVLNDNLELLPPGIPGCLYLGGLGLAFGYYNDEEKTRDKFVYHPKLNRRIYNTGDLVKWDEFGKLHFINRTDFQVKFNGYRIELEEIELCIAKHTDAKNIIVDLKQNESDEVFLCAYIVSDDFDKEELDLKLREELPTYMVPQFYFNLSTIPLTFNGKINRKALPIPTSSSSKANSNKLGENTKDSIYAVWAKVLNVETSKLDENANFYRFGGNSYKTLQLLSSIEEVTGVKISIDDFVKNPIIENVLQIIGNSGSQTTNNQNQIRAEKKEYYPLSPAQKRLFYHYNIEPKSINYNVPSLFKVVGKLDSQKLENSLRTLIERNKILRTCFKVEEGEDVQYILNHFKCPFRSFELAENDLDNKVKEDIYPFNLSNEVPVRLFYYSLEGATDYFLLDLHHIVTDGVSLNLIFRELLQIYEEKELKDVTYQFIDFVSDKKINTERATKESEIYWQSIIDFNPGPLSIPLSNNENETKGYNGDNVTFSVDKPKLDKLAKDNETSMYMLIVAFLNVLFSKLCNTNNVTIGSPIIIDREFGTAEMMGPFINTIILHNTISEESTFTETLKQIHNNGIRAISHSSYPYNEIVQLNVEKQKNRTLFNVMLDYHNEQERIDKIDFAGNEVTFLNDPRKICLFDINVHAIEQNEIIEFKIDYSTERFVENDILFIKEELIDLIQHVTENENVLIKDIHGAGKKSVKIDIPLDL